MIEFVIKGRKVKPHQIEDALTRAVIEGITAEIREKVGSIRDPETGEFPTVVVHGDNLDRLQIKVEGSPAIIDLVRKRLGLEDEAGEDGVEEDTRPPRVFLSYTSDDLAFAQRIAQALQENGIDTWWDKWCIRAGDSLRQKIDEGLADCTHFLVLLTPQSIGKPWVNQEMDAGLIRKLSDKCRFLPVRHQLPASELSPLLSGLHSPEISGDEDITQLINDIFGVSRKPPLGAVPQSLGQTVDAKTGYSPAATAIARLFVERTRNAMLADPQFNIDNLAKESGLSIDDATDGLYELSSLLKVSRHHVLVQPSLFTEFDRFWKPWDPAEDALKLAADIANDPEFPADCGEIAGRYGWDARRLNPAITYLFDQGMLLDYEAINSKPFVMVRVVGKRDPVRRFVKSRS